MIYIFRGHTRAHIKGNEMLFEIIYTLLLLLLTGTIFSYFCMSSITSVLILAILIAIVLF